MTTTDARRDLWTPAQVAEHRGLGSAASARSWLARHQVPAVRRDLGGNKLYDPDAVRAVTPLGRGTRTDLKTGDRA